MSATEDTFPGPRRTLLVMSELLSIEHGLWCDACALPSAHRVTFAMTIGGRTDLHQRVVCEDHR